MALSDCIKCWDTPCTCGEYWKNYSNEAKLKQCEAIMGEKMYSLATIKKAFIAGGKAGYNSIKGLDFQTSDDWIKENL